MSFDVEQDSSLSTGIVRVSALALATAAAIACGSSGGEDRAGFGGAGNSPGTGGVSVGTGGTAAGPAGGTGGTANTGGFLTTGGAGGGGNTTGVTDGGECQGISQEATNRVRPVDIIWAVDTSDSMVAELFAVEQHLNNFSNFILNQGIDVHVVMIGKPGRPDAMSGLFNPDPGFCIGPPLATGSCPGGSNPPVYQHVEVGVGSNSALQRIIDQYPNYKPTLRQNALKYFSVVSDDNSDLNAADFTNQLNALDPAYFTDWKFFGVFCPSSCFNPIVCPATGTVYNALVQQTGGVAGDLCGAQADFGPVFTQLAQTVVDGRSLDCEWDIPPPPPGEMFDSSKINVDLSSQGVSGPVLHAGDFAGCDPNSGGWYYDNPDAPTKVLACPATCNRIQFDFNAKIDIKFGCFTVDIPR